MKTQQYHEPVSCDATFRKTAENAGMNSFHVQIANIREHVSWAHPAGELTTQKAIDLVAAATAGRATEVRDLLVGGVDANTKNATGRPVLVLAGFNGNRRTVQALLAAGADAQGWTQLTSGTSKTLRGVFSVSSAMTIICGDDGLVLFNSMRGGVFDEQYLVKTQDFAATVRHFNRAIYQRNESLLNGLPQKVRVEELVTRMIEHGDTQLERLAREYLPITFGRRHGDPSRPWNQFAIRLKDSKGNRLLSY